MQEQEWLASVLPSQQQLDDVLGNDPAAALLGLARSRAPRPRAHHSTLSTSPIVPIHT